MDRKRETRGLLLVSLFSIGTGGAVAAGAELFRLMVAFFHNLFFLRELSFLYDPARHTASNPWGPFVMLVPVAGALIAASLIRKFAPEAEGPGVSEVLDSLYYRGGIIRPALAFFKPVITALSIGSGASVGREGPVIQIGSALGSSLGQLPKMPAWQRYTLIAAGAGGAIASTYNTPIGGILFAVEIMLLEVSVRTVVPVLLSVAAATTVSRLLFGAVTVFSLPAGAYSAALVDLTALVDWTALTVPSALLGGLMGLVSAAFILSISGSRSVFRRLLKKNPVIRHASGMLIVGVTGYLLFITTGRYQVEGLGYATIQDILSAAILSPAFLLLLLVLKGVVTAVSLGSGASGGVFTPALYIGASLGSALAMGMNALFPGLRIDPSAFALVGMAASVGGITGAGLTAISMILEMTRIYGASVQLILAVALCYWVRKLIVRDSVYTLRLAQQGHPIRRTLLVNVRQLLPASRVMDRRLNAVPASLTLGALVSDILPEYPSTAWFLSEKDGTVTGIASRDRVVDCFRTRGPDAAFGETAESAFVTVQEKTPLFRIIARMRDQNAGHALVASSNDTPRSAEARGVISTALLLEALTRDQTDTGG